MPTIIEPKQKIGSAWIRELWQFRGLFATLVSRDIKVRYKQTVVGILWAILQPLTLMVIFGFLFSHFKGITNSSPLAYPLFVFSGLIFWQFFSGSVSSASNALVSNQALIHKIYIPRLLIPLSKIGVHGVDFIIGVGITAALCLIYGAGTLWSIPAFFLSFIIIFMTSCGLGCFFSILNAKYRDIRFVIPFFIQISLFISPIIYSSKLFADYATLLHLNPLTGAIEVARASLAGTAPDMLLISISFISATVIFIIGILYFKRGERYIADII